MQYPIQCSISTQATALLLFTYSALALAGPPFVTDDPEPVEYQHWEVNYAVAKSWRHQESSAAMPSIDINYGLTKDLQIHAQPRYSYEKTISNKATGFDNTEVGMKYRFINIDYGGSSLMAGIYPMLELPTADNSLRPHTGKTKTFIPAWVQFNKNKWTAYGGIGYRVNPGADNQNSLYLGSAVLYQLTPSLQLGGEAFHETPDTQISHSVAGFNLGGKYQLTEDYNFLFSAGRGFMNIESTNKCSLYLAMQVLY